MYTRCLIKYFYGIFFTHLDSLMSTKLWGFARFLFRNMFTSLVVHFTYLAPNVHFSCLAHCHLLHIPLPLMSCLAQYLVSTSLVCYVYFMQRCFVFCLIFISHSSCIPYVFISLFISSFVSLILLGAFVYSCQKGEEHTREYIGEYIGLLCTFLGREIS